MYSRPGKCGQLEGEQGLREAVGDMPVSLLPAQLYQRPSQQWRRLPDRRTAVAPQAAATRQVQVCGAGGGLLLPHQQSCSALSFIPLATVFEEGRLPAQIGDAIVTAPVQVPKGAVHFLGGAFAGAAPYLVVSQAPSPGPSPTQRSRTHMWQRMGTPWCAALRGPHLE